MNRAEQLFEEAKRLLMSGDSNEAIEKFAQAANLGSERARTVLETMFPESAPEYPEEDIPVVCEENEGAKSTSEAASGRACEAAESRKCANEAASARTNEEVAEARALAEELLKRVREEAENYPTLDNYNKADLNIQGTTLVKYKGSGGEVKIPKGITEIANEAFNGTAVTAVTIPDGVRMIRGNAFHCCYELKTINIPNSVRAIGAGAFSACAALTSIKIPDSVMEICSSTFSGCASLTVIEIPNSVEYLQDGAFAWCNLKSIYIPASVIAIEGRNPFHACRELTSIEVAADNKRYKSENDCLIEIATGKLVAVCNKSHITIPMGVKSIGDFAFAKLDLVSTVDIPDGVTYIGEYAFCGCSRLKTIKIPKSVTSIGEHAFHECDHLTTVEILEGVTSIEKYAFSDCSRLTSITIPASVQTVEYGIFSGSGLKEIRLPKKISGYDLRIPEGANVVCY